MAKLKPLEKRWIVSELACYTAIADVVAGFAEQFPGRTTDRKQVWEYDFSKPGNRVGMSDELVALFDATRKAYLEETKDVQIAHKGYRLRKLQEILEQELAGKMRKSAKATLEQAAKESGDAFTNHRILTGPNGTPLPTMPPVVQVNLNDLSEDELNVLEKLHGRNASKPGQHPKSEG